MSKTNDRPTQTDIAVQSARWERVRAAYWQTIGWNAIKVQRHLDLAEAYERKAEQLYAQATGVANNATVVEERQPAAAQ